MGNRRIRERKDDGRDWFQSSFNLDSGITLSLLISTVDTRINDEKGHSQESAKVKSVKGTDWWQLAIIDEGSRIETTVVG